MTHDPRHLATAIDIVLRAGEIQLAHFNRDLRIDKKAPSTRHGSRLESSGCAGRFSRNVPVARDPG
jgi:hypothetical protein